MGHFSCQRVCQQQENWNILLSEKEQVVTWIGPNDTLLLALGPSPAPQSVKLGNPYALICCLFAIDKRYKAYLELFFVLPDENV